MKKNLLCILLLASSTYAVANTSIPSDDGAIMPINVKAVRSVTANFDASAWGKAKNCVNKQEMSKDGCMAYGALGIAKAYSAAGYSFRASIIDAAQDQGVSYSMAQIGDLILPLILAIRTDDGANFMVQKGVIKSSDVPYLRDAFTEK